MSKNVFQDELFRKEGKLYTRLYIENNHLNLSDFTKEEKYAFDLRGEKVRCMYSQLFNQNDNMILCNNITQVDEFWLENIENGSIFYYEDNEGNYYTESEKDDFVSELEERKEELEGLIEELEEGNKIQELQKELEEIEENIDSLEYEHNTDIYQFYIIDDNLADCLKGHTDELIIYNQELDIYILCVTHWGTSWNCVSSEFTF